jgi:hypothetical protein
MPKRRGHSSKYETRRDEEALSYIYTQCWSIEACSEVDYDQGRYQMVNLVNPCHHADFRIACEMVKGSTGASLVAGASAVVVFCIQDRSLGSKMVWYEVVRSVARKWIATYLAWTVAG